MMNRQDDSNGASLTPSVHIDHPIAAHSSMGGNEPHANRRDWFQVALYIIAAVAAVGLGIALLGVYLLDNPVVMLVGALMVSGSAVTWIIGAWFVIGAWLMRRFRRHSDEMPQASPKE